MTNNIRTLSAVFEDLAKSLTNETVSVAALLEALHERGFGFIILLFSVPMALPLPVPPGINFLLATPLLILTMQQAMGRHTIWMPEKIKNKTFHTKKLRAILNASIPWIRKIESLSKPRLIYITEGVFSHIIGVLGFIMASYVLIPLPLTHSVPSLGIALMAAGVIMRDGIVVISGAMIGIGWISLLTGTAIVFGMDGLEALKTFIVSKF